jgi:putative membrane protein insertion efficiency factor
MKKMPMQNQKHIDSSPLSLVRGGIEGGETNGFKAKPLPLPNPLPRFARERGSWLSILLKAPVHAYKYLVSPWLPPACRFHPTCSDYCLQALEKHGPLTALWLTAKRLAVCHPWSKRHGYDPVPDKIEGK